MAAMSSADALPKDRVVEYPLSPSEFSTIAKRLHQDTGINLASNRLDLVQGRLARRLRALRLDSFAQYIALLDSPDGVDEKRQMTNALTTNLTGFFREKHHFDYLEQTILPDLMERRKSSARRIRIWSAGCSSGEEPYTIAMTIAARLPDLKNWDARVLATDIDTDMVAFGHAGRYDASRTEPVPDALRRRFLSPADEDDTVEVSDSLRTLVSFKQLNLLQTWPMRGPFDVIFCRNVVIYFNEETQRKLFSRFADLLMPGGWLFVGHSESLARISDRYDHLGRTIYRTKS